MGNRFLRIAVVYILLGVTLGIVMAASHDYTLRPVHAHVNLVGWASMGLFGLFYRFVPAAAESALAKAHFWIYNLALPVLAVTLGMYVSGYTAVEPVLAISSIAIAIALLCFAVVLWKHTAN